MNFNVFILLFLFQHARSQSTYATLSSAAFRVSTTTDAPRTTSTLSFDTLSSAAFRTTTTTGLSVCTEELRSSCKNGATCFVVNSANFFCLCPAGFTGIDCGLAVSTTVSSTTPRITTTAAITTTALASSTTTSKQSLVECPVEFNGICRNGGKCLLVNSVDIRCECQPQFTGVLCQTALFPETTTILTTSTTALETTVTLTTRTTTPEATRTTTALSTETTTPLTTRTTTESKVACPPGVARICQNEAKCFIINDDDILCECKDGFTGKLCESAASTTTATTIETTTAEKRELCPFQPGPCRNGGECELINDARIECNCKTGFTGDFCEITSRAPCPFNICQNDGVCEIINAADLECTCKDGFTGAVCQLRL